MSSALTIYLRHLFCSAFLTKSGDLNAANDTELHLWPSKEFRSTKASEILFRPNLLAQFRFRSRFLNLRVQLITVTIHLRHQLQQFISVTNLHNGDDGFCEAQFISVTICRNLSPSPFCTTGTMSSVQRNL